MDHGLRQETGAGEAPVYGNRLRKEKPVFVGGENRVKRVGWRNHGFLGAGWVLTEDSENRSLGKPSVSSNG